MYVEVMSPLMGEAVKHIVQHDRVSDSSKPGQWVYGSSASNISETCVAEPRDFNHWEYQGTCLRYPHSHLFQVSYMSVLLVEQQTFRPCGSNPFSVWSGGLRVTGRKTTDCDTGSIPVSDTWRVRSSRQPYILCLVQTPYCASHRRI